MSMTLTPSPLTSRCLCVRPELLTEDGCWVLCPANNYCFDAPEYPWDDENYPEGTIPAEGPTYQKRCPGVSVSPPRSTSLAHCVCPVAPCSPPPHILVVLVGWERFASICRWHDRFGLGWLRAVEEPSHIVVCPTGRENHRMHECHAMHSCIRWTSPVEVGVALGCMLH